MKPTRVDIHSAPDAQGRCRYTLHWIEPQFIDGAWQDAPRSMDFYAVPPDLTKPPHPSFCVHPAKCAGHSQCQREICCLD